jgi:hypothetical protein
MIDRTRASAIVMTAWAAMACGSSEQQTEAGSGVVPGPAQPAPGSMEGVAGMPSTGGSSGNGMGGGASPSEEPATGENGASGSSPPLAPCTGCVELVAPMSGANSADNLQDQVGYQFNIPAPGADFRSARITWRIMAAMNNDNLFVSLYAQNGAPDYSNVYPAGPALSTVNFPPGEWVGLTLDLATYGYLPGTEGAEATGAPLADPGTFDKTAVESFGIQLKTGGAFTGTRAIRLLIDSVTVEGAEGQSTRSFDEGAEGLIVNQYQVPLGTQPPLHY